MSKKNKSYITGTLRLNHRGFGFLIPDNRKMCPKDIFIPRSGISGALDGDKVSVELLPRFRDKGPEGCVKKILKRGRSTFLGTILQKSGKHTVLAHAIGLGADPVIHLMPTEANIEDRVLFEIVNWGTRNQPPMGRVIKIIGPLADPSCDVAAALAEYNIEATFPEDALKEAQAYGTKISPKDLRERIDYTTLETITIDPATAKDFDDALSLKKEGSHYHLVVHIADVSHYVTPGSALDQEARERCNSVYFPGTVVPMLPHELSSHLCSLMPRVKRLTISVAMEFSEDGTLLDYRIARGVIKSAKRFSYEEARDVLLGKIKSPHLPLLQRMVELCLILKKQRAQRGSIEFALPDTMIMVDDKGMPTGLHVVEYDITHQLVEEFMLKANEIVATHLFHLNKPLTYRIHEEPSPESIRDFVSLARSLSFKVPKDPDNEDLQQLFDQARESAFGKFLATAFIRSMKLASYSTQNVGHYGLCLEHYTHFTSPIRRYIDLIVHRVLFSSYTEEDLDAVATACSEKERLSAKAENSVIQLKKLRYLQYLLEQDPKRIFEATIAKIKPSGFVFEIQDCLLEGFIPTPNYYFDEKRQSLCNAQKQHTYRTGDRIKVSVVRILLIELEIEWQLCYKSRCD